MVSAREKREERQERVSAKGWAAKNTGGFEGTSVKLPEGVNFFAIDKAGSVRVEIVPYKVPKGSGNPMEVDGQMYFERTFFTHRGIGSNEGTYICLAQTAKLPCPICEERRRLVKDGDGGKDETDIIKSLAPKKRQLFNIYDHANPDKGVQVWDVSWHLFGKHLKARIDNADEEDEYEFFADPADGKTLKLGFEEKSLPGSSFYECNSIDFKSRAEPLDPDILAGAHVLDNLLIIEPYERLKAIFLMTGEEKTAGDDGDKDEPPKKTKTPPKDDDDVPSPSTKKKDGPPVSKAAEGMPKAADFGIERGMQVLHDEWGVCKVLKVSGDGTSLTLLDEDDEPHAAVGPDAVRLMKKKAKAAENGNGAADDKSAKQTAKVATKKEEDDDEPPAKAKGKAAAKDDDDAWDSWDDEK